MKRRLTLLALFGVAVGSAHPAWSGEDRSGSTALGAAAAFDRLKALVGTWRGKSMDGQPVTIEYKLGARGTTLIETQDPGREHEMISIYSRDGEELVMTHYCPMGPVGNQPHFRLDRTRSTAAALFFTFASGTNLDAEKDAHVHAGRFVWLASGSLRREWDVYDSGRQEASLVFQLARSR